MASSVNKRSLREEVDVLKADFKQLSSAGKLTPESLTLINALLMVLEVVLAVFMEKMTKKGAGNSSIPTSQTEKDETTLTHKGAKGKGNEQNDAQSSNRRTIETTEVVRVDQCANCGADLSDTPSCRCERRTMIDVVFETVVTHVEAEVKACPECDTETKGRFPSDMPGPLQYGTGIKAYMLNLLIAQMVSLDRVQKSIKTLIGRAISQATMLKWVTQLYLALERWEESAIETLLGMPSMNVDETSLRVNKKNYWIHVHSAGDITVKCLHRKRGCEAIDANNIIPRYGGVIIHDCWASYLTYDHCDHGLCGSHLTRELQFVIESNHYRWAANMKRCLLDTCVKVSKRKNKKLNAREYKALQKRYKNILTRGEKELPPIPARQKGKRGRIAKSAAHNLWERLKEHQTAVLLFAKESHVPFTNNRAERDLRMSKVKQKVSGCFRTEHYAKAYCRISSYLQTMGNRGYNPLVAIQLALTGQLYAEGCE